MMVPTGDLHTCLAPTAPQSSVLAACHWWFECHSRNQLLHLGTYGVFPVFQICLCQSPVEILWKYWWQSKINWKESRRSCHLQDKNRNKRRFCPCSSCTWLENKAGNQNCPIVPIGCPCVGREHPEELAGHWHLENEWIVLARCLRTTFGMK